MDSERDHATQVETGPAVLRSLGRLTPISPGGGEARTCLQKQKFAEKQPKRLHLVHLERLELVQALLVAPKGFSWKALLEVMAWM